METTRPSIQRTVILIAATIGAVTCLVATVVSFWYAIGATPPVLYGPQVHWLATMVRYGNVPVEFIGLAWFVAVGLVYWFSPPRETSAAYAWVFCTSVAIVAGAIALSRGHLDTWAFMIAAAAAGLVLVVSGSEQTPPVRTWPRLVRHDALSIARSPLGVAIVLTFLSSSIIGAQFLSLKTATVSSAQAADQVFKRWFLTQSRATSSDLVASKGIRIVTFTDYQCPACASTVVQNEATIEAFRRAQPLAPIEVVYKDFPLESECNATLQNQMHPAACEAAVAVRLVRAKVGNDAAHDFGVSLYRNRSQLSPEYIEGRLNEYHLVSDYKQQYATILKDVVADVALGTRLGVRSTPTSFVNGTKMPNIAVRNFELALQYEAQRVTGIPANDALTSTTVVVR